MIYPGLTSLAALRSNPSAELEVNVTGIMWQWMIEYPESGVWLVSAGDDEPVLPAERRVKLNVTSLDAPHASRVPAFRVNADAVPGYTAELYVTLNRPGDPAEIACRLQCAELCRLLHGRMAMPLVSCGASSSTTGSLPGARAP